jgi:prepilin-type N-terminal cleavage/methylation domain-containing protein
MRTRIPRRRYIGTWGDDRGFTLYELLVVIAIVGVLIAIAIIIWLGLLEQRRVDAAANQLAADMRLAHGSATNHLTDWQIVLAPERDDESEGPDYYLVRLAAPHASKSPVLIDPETPPKPRYFPANVKVRDHKSDLNDAPANPHGLIPGSPRRTRTLEYNSDGSMAFKEGPAGTVCVTIDGDPQRRVTSAAATSRARVKEPYNEKPCN